ncbi:MAG: isoprenylcysteine carboxylmethyltransferase family protein [Deltaproteobacteria bacterium]|nr:isoprenylcysteine carboxylmethyltransferase family protein [Candidatus Desulfobacula maris]
MTKIWLIILIHQLIFQGMFAMKNIILHIKTGKQIRGNNTEANVSIAFFVLLIGVSFVFSLQQSPLGQVKFLSTYFSTITGLVLLVLNLTISLIHLKDSWRVGVVENQKTVLITSGIYRFTRNPYFVSYFFMFLAYTVLLQNLILLGLSIMGFIFVHIMIKKEEKYLYSVHGDAYLQYKKTVPRYLIV